MADPASSHDRLDSWKAIAAHLGREARTVQRWERFEGLPVHRLEHRKRGSVYAYAAELDTWLAARRPPDALAVPAPVATPPSARAWPYAKLAVSSGAVALAALGALWLYHRPPTASAPPAVLLPPQVHRLFAAATSEDGRWDMIPAGPSPSAVAVASGGRELYVANEDARTVSVLDAAAHRLRATLRLSIAPQVLATDADGSRVFAAGAESRGLQVIDTRSHQVSEVALDAGVLDMLLSPHDHSLYLALGFDGLARLDLATGELLRVATSVCPASLALAPGGAVVYVGFQCGGPGGRRGRDAIGVFDTAAHRFVRTIAGDVPLVATALAASPDGNELWASAGDVCTAAYDHTGCPPGAVGLLYIFHAADGRLLQRIPVPRPINHIAFLAGGSRVLLDGLLFDATRHEVLEAMPEPIGGFAVAQDRRVYLSLPRRNAIARLQSPRDNCAPPPDGLLAWWPGDGSAAEARGDLAALPSPTLGYAPARLGQGFRFDGHATLALGHDISLARPWAQGLTIGAWIKPFAVNAGVLFQKDSPNGWNLGLAADDHLRACLSSAQPCLEDPQPLSWAAWHYIALGGDRRGASLWVDGRAVARTPRTPSASAARADLTAGAGFAGLMDEIVVYEHALSGAEVRALMDLPHCLASVGGSLEEP